MGPIPRRGHSGPGRAALALVAAVALLLGGCGDDDEPSGRGAPVEGEAPSTAGAGGTATTGSAPAGEGPSVALGEVAVRLTPVAEASRPTKLMARPGSELLYVAEQEGTVRALEVGDELAEVATALDLTDVTTTEGNEQGLLGLAFSPDGATLYVHHSGREGETRIASFAMDGDVADPASRTDLLTVDQPFANHNGGDIVVDPDGLLWIGLGDGGAAGDPDDRAQDPDDLLGKVLRVDPARPSGGRPYGIPPDNPFADGGGRPEVAVTGVRNPWRLRLDPATGDLWVADVGQDAWEELDRLPAGSILGANLGWSRFEGSHEFDAGRPVRGPDPVLPVFEMAHDDGWCSVTGGVVYRGSAVEGLDGAYLFGDLCRPGLSALRPVEGAGPETAVLDDEVEQVVSIDAGADGEVYVLTYSGTIHRLDPA